MRTVEVLLVEDNPGDALLVRRALEEGPVPVRLTIAEDGAQALWLLTKGEFKPDLVILDLNLPRLDGHGVLRNYQSKQMPVVVFSSSSDKRDMEQALANGASEYVHKPTDFQGFEDAVRGMVSKWVKPD